MIDLIKSKESLAWLALTALTCVSWVLGNKYDALEPHAYVYMTVGVLFIAFFKVRLVIMHFMEIGHAPPGLRYLAEAWCLIFFVIVSVIYLTG